MEVEKELIAASQKERIYENSVNFLKKNIQKCLITQKEVKSEINQDRKIYRPLGN